MRFRHAFVFLAIALVSASASSDEPIVALSIEPELSAPAPTLESAARANDYATFDALYRANPDPAYRALHELWTYAMTDPVGAFYGAEMYARLSREYPAYASYIAHYRIVDGKGETFYPASETRAFLLENRTAAAPLERVAERAEPRVEPRRTEARRPLAGRSTGSLPVAADAAGSVPAGSRRTGRPAAGAPVQEAAVAPEPKPAPAPAPVEDLVLLNTVTTAAAPAPAPVSATTQTSAAAAPKSTNRGLLLIILGLAGVGLLALILRAPREVIQ